MSEADRVFPRDPNQPQGGESRDRRVIVKSPRRNGPGGGTSRTVEVVHVRRGAPRPAEDQPRAASRHTHAETWPDGFRAKAPPPPLLRDDIAPPPPEPVAPTVHVMPAWERTVQEAPLAETTPAEIPLAEIPIAEPAIADAAVAAPAAVALSPKAKPTRRRFADPLAEDDDGANCLRCGYLVEAARDRRGLRTCAACG